MTNEYEILKRSYWKKTSIQNKCKFQKKVNEVFLSSRSRCRLPFMGCYFEKQSTHHAFIQFGFYLAGPLGLETRYLPDQTDQNMGIGQTEQTEICVLARPNWPKYGYWPDQTDQNMGIGQTEQTKIWVLARPKYGYWPDRTDRIMGIGQTEIWVFARPNRLKLPLARRKARPKFFPDHCGRSHRTPMSATQVRLANICLGSRTSSWVARWRDTLKYHLNIVVNFFEADYSKIKF